MGVRQPSIRQHVRGHYFVRWNGRDHYLGRDRAAAERAFLDPAGAHPGALINWQHWRAGRQRPRPPGARLRVIDLVDAFCDHYLDAGRRPASAYYRKHLKRFSHAYGTQWVDQVDPAAIAAIMAGMQRAGHAPKTIQHDVKAIKTCWRWGTETFGPRVPMINLDARICRPPRTPEPLPVHLSASERSRMLAACAASCPLLGAWASVQYLCLLRPTEVRRTIDAFQAGSIVERCDAGLVLRLSRGKSDHQGWPRYVFVSAESHQWLSSIHAPPRGHWSESRYGELVRACAPWPPRVLRSSAASDLRRLGVAREEIDLLLGHAPRSVSRHYVRESMPRLVARAARLSL